MKRVLVIHPANERTHDDLLTMVYSTTLADEVPQRIAESTFCVLRPWLRKYFAPKYECTKVSREGFTFELVLVSEEGEENTPEYFIDRANRCDAPVTPIPMMMVHDKLRAYCNDVLVKGGIDARLLEIYNNLNYEEICEEVFASGLGGINTSKKLAAVTDQVNKAVDDIIRKKYGRPADMITHFCDDTDWTTK